MANLAKNASLSNQQKTLKPVAELHGKLVEKNSISEEMRIFLLMFCMMIIFLIIIMSQKDEREKEENKYEYFYTEECSNCHNIRNAVTKNKDLEVK